MSALQLGASFVSRLAGLYMVMVGIRILLAGGRSADTGAVPLGLIIPVTETEIYIYSIGMISAGALLAFLLPKWIGRFSRFTVLFGLAAGSVAVGTVFGYMGIELPKAGLGIIQMFDWVRLTEPGQQRIGAWVLQSLAFVFLLIVPVLLFRHRWKAAVSVIGLFTVVLAGLTQDATAAKAPIPAEYEARIVVERYLESLLRHDIESMVQYADDLRFPAKREQIRQYRTISDEISEARVLSVTKKGERIMEARIHAVVGGEPGEFTFPVIRKGSHWRVIVGQDRQA
ncbi:hypothetical protein ACP26L_13280 [Paenibacillus sp. S-38]|uniref:hypothetical protein n=1 Tax=Paenibacillus sp. S-38 TaxID=3416710 RepID=UPI003CE771D9